jgi:hypothetical protein
LLAPGRQALRHKHDPLTRITPSPLLLLANALSLKYGKAHHPMASKEDVKGLEERLTARLDRIENLILKDYGQRIETLEKHVKKLMDALAV